MVYHMSEQLYLYYYNCKYACKHNNVTVKHVLLA